MRMQATAYGGEVMVRRHYSRHAHNRALTPHLAFGTSVCAVRAAWKGACATSLYLVLAADPGPDLGDLEELAVRVGLEPNVEPLLLDEDGRRGDLLVRLLLSEPTHGVYVLR